MSDENGPRAHLATERAHPKSAALDRLEVADAVRLFDEVDAEAYRAVAEARAEITAAIELVSRHMQVGGRLIYVGAGTSGRLGVLDAVECPPTFQSRPERVQGRIAGGPEALTSAIEGAEDDREAGRNAVDDVTTSDIVFGIAAGGTTPFVHGAIERARERGAATVFLACVPRADAPDDADVSIRLDTGPELLAGSTRLKAGTATKLVLNRVTTISMARLGKVHGNRMVDLNTRGSAKLKERGASILSWLTDLPHDAALDLLDRADGRVKVAALMHEKGLEPAAALALLARHDGFLRAALED